MIILLHYSEWLLMSTMIRVNLNLFHSPAYICWRIGARIIYTRQSMSANEYTLTERHPLISLDHWWTPTFPCITNFAICYTISMIRVSQKFSDDSPLVFKGFVGKGPISSNMRWLILFPFQMTSDGYFHKSLSDL